ncbi:universal stress protein [Rhodococcus sp. ARC_M6]|uniref:universal stress protein n=1 Tax=Rhodococcus sp. ARC_M6 TaxID=2928852 RepID=UPI001FB3C349|nr:universal stress protein [Rhodococcus sp. ARC_M6]MCJ0903314.1 universal stress protein [Rhodococcus sp. ARC_M6]
MVRSPIIVGIDGSQHSLDALRWAAREATLRAVPLLLLCCTTYRRTDDGPHLVRELHARADRVLAAALEVARAATAGEPIEIQTEVSLQYAPGALIDRSEGAVMIVLGRRGLGEFSGRLVGSVSSAVARQAHCPVVVIDGWSRGKDSTDPVVVGVDGSMNSEPAIGLAFEECALHGAALIVLHACFDQDLSSPQVDAGAEVRAAVEAAGRLVLAESVSRWWKRFPDVGVRQNLVRDRPVHHLLALAGDAQLVVVGNRGRGGFAGMTLGSTGSALLHRTPCPLVIVRRPGGESVDERGSPELSS